MEKEKTDWNSNPIWPIPGFRHIDFYFLGKRNFSKSSGFTVVEILIAIVVLGFIAYFAFILFDPVTKSQQERDGKRKADLAGMQVALENFYQDHRQYPKSSENKILRLDGTVAEWGTQWLPYMEMLPQDESENKKYVYFVTPSRQSYYIYASLDRDDDTDACFSKKACVSAESNALGHSCGNICNYGVSSPNASP